MTIDDWSTLARADADARNLPDLGPLLESLAAAMRTVRAGDWNPSAAGREPAAPTSDVREA